MGDSATLERRGRWAAIAVGAVLVTDLVAIWSDWLQMRLLDRAIDGDEIALSTFASDDGRQAVVALLQTLVFVLAVVFFLRWFHRA